MSEKVQWIEWPTFVEEGGGIRRATDAEVLREFNKTINENAHLRALLAQRDGELEALRGKVARVLEARRSSVSDWELDRGYIRLARLTDELDSLAALSDNQEGR